MKMRDLPHCVRHIPVRSPRGPLQSTVIKELRSQEAAISFPSNPFRKQAFVGAAQNEISIAFAMLTP